MSVQKFFGGSFNGFLWEDQGGSSRHDHDDPPGTIRCSLEIGNPALVMNLRGSWDVLAFCPMRRLATGLSREKALAVASAARGRK